jgi:malonyl-ACP decarboxylase
VAHQGFVFGEGAAAVVLEQADVAGARGAEKLAVLRDGVSALDGTHLTHPSQEGQEFVMREALRRSGVAPGELDLVSAHATSTPLGDKAESKAIGAVLGAAAGRPWVNATKALIGHCLGPAALIEAVACVAQMRGGYVHPNVNLTQPITGELRFAPAEAVRADIRYALSNSFGFGGINTSVVIESATAASDPGARKD